MHKAKKRGDAGRRSRESSLNSRTRRYAERWSIYQMTVDLGPRYYFRYATGLDLTANLYVAPFSETSMGYQYSRLEYLKTGACTYGNYINVPALSVKEDFPSKNAITISPNPADDLLHISFEENISGNSLCITDLQGRTLLEGPLDSRKNILSVSNLPVGMYLLRVGGKNFQHTQKLLIER